MGSPPPENFPPPTVPTLGASFATPSATVALPCGLSASIPSWLLKLGISISLPFAFPPAFPKLNLRFKLTCDPNNPVDVSGGLSWGAGRASNVPPDPDDHESDPTF